MAFAVVLQACGDDAAPRGPEPKVRLQVTVPQDGATVRAETVAVEGTVAPAGARVQVLGKDVGVESGRWHAEVPLEPGANLVDVAASADGRRTAFASLRIVLEVRVTVPDVGRVSERSKRLRPVAAVRPGPGTAGRGCRTAEAAREHNCRRAW